MGFNIPTLSVSLQTIGGCPFCCKINVKDYKIFCPVIALDLYHYINGRYIQVYWVEKSSMLHRCDTLKWCNYKGAPWIEYWNHKWRLSTDPMLSSGGWQWMCDIKDNSTGEYHNWRCPTGWILNSGGWQWICDTKDISTGNYLNWKCSTD